MMMMMMMVMMMKTTAQQEVALKTENRQGDRGGRNVFVKSWNFLCPSSMHTLWNIKLFD